VPGVLSAYLDQIVMSFYLPPRSFAVYALGARELPLVGAVGPSVSSVLIPHLVEDVAAGRSEQVCRRWRKACLTTAMVTYPVAAFAIVNAVPVMLFMFSEAYRESSVPFRIFAAITFLRVVEYASLAKAFNKTGAILRSTLFSTTVQVALAFLLTWRFGVVGMASAVFLGYAAGAGYLLAANGRILGHPLSDFFPWGGLIALWAVALCATIAASRLLASVIPLVGQSGMLQLGWRLAVHFSASAGAYGLALLVLGILWKDLPLPPMARAAIGWRRDSSMAGAAPERSGVFRG
jgi:O-antigen/teichoic acid export membrane protein